MSPLSYLPKLTMLLILLYLITGCSGVKKIKNGYTTVEQDSMYTKMVLMKNFDNQMFELQNFSKTETGYFGTINIDEPWKRIPRKANFVVFYTDSLKYKQITPELLEVDIPYHQIYRTIHTQNCPFASAKRNSALVFTVLSLTLYAVSSAGVL